MLLTLIWHEMICATFKENYLHFEWYNIREDGPSVNQARARNENWELDKNAVKQWNIRYKILSVKTCNSSYTTNVYFIKMSNICKRQWFFWWKWINVRDVSKGEGGGLKSMCDASLYSRVYRTRPSILAWVVGGESKIFPGPCGRRRGRVITNTT